MNWDMKILNPGSICMYYKFPFVTSPISELTTWIRNRMDVHVVNSHKRLTQEDTSEEKLKGVVSC